MKEVGYQEYLMELLEQEGWEVTSSADQTGPADLMAVKGRVEWVIEIKGRQANERAYRNSFFTGLGQLVVAVGQTGSSRLSIALTAGFDDLLDKHGKSLFAGMKGKSFSVLRMDKKKNVWEETGTKRRQVGSSRPTRRYSTGKSSRPKGWGRDVAEYAGRSFQVAYGDKRYTMRVSASGICSVKGMGEFETPSAAGRAITGYPVNGYRFWSMDE